MVEKEKLIKAFKEINLEDVRILEENVDEQFVALNFLHKKLKNDDKFVSLVVLNSLVSYQLNTSGEVYWKNFSKYFSENLDINETEGMINFIKNYNKRILRAKVKRIKRIEHYLELIKEKKLEFYNDMIEFWRFISKVMNQSRYSKTISFCVKMFGYAMRICTKKFISFPFEIPIPLDSRIIKITKKITNENPIDFWFRFSKEVKIPPLHIDSVLWNLSRKELILPKNLEKFNKIKNFLESLNI